MAKDTFWFRHDYDAADDDKTMLLIEQLGLEGYGIYWVLIEKLRGRKDYKMPFSVVPSLARRYMTTPEKMKTVITQYDLFQYDEDGFFFSKALIERMQKLDELKEKRSEAGRLGMSRRWEQKKIANEQHCYNNDITMLQQSYNDVITNDNKDITSYNDKSRVDKNGIEYKEKEDNKLSSKKKVFDFKKALVDIGVDESVAIDWIAVRKTKHATQTRTAFEKVRKQIELSGVSANECITLAVERSWAGFKAEWYIKENPTSDVGLFSESLTHDNNWQTL